MATALGRTLYWVGTGLGVLLGGLGIAILAFLLLSTNYSLARIFQESSEGHLVLIPLGAGVLCWLSGRVFRYIFAGE